MAVIFYLSSYIIQHKADYYRLLQEVRTKDSWEEWIMYMLEWIEQTALKQIELINEIKELMDKTKEKLKNELPKIYSKELLEILFMHPYTKISMLEVSLGLHRETASKYLNAISKLGILNLLKLGRTKFFVNIELFELLKKEMS